MFEIGQEVYYQENWSGSIIKAKIVSFTEDMKGANINDICHPTYPKDHFCYRAFGSRTYPLELLSDSLEDIKERIRLERDAAIKQYKEQIKTIEDLINFPLYHCFNGEEYTDYEAMQAYKERAGELGFNIKK